MTLPPSLPATMTITPAMPSSARVAMRACAVVDNADVVDVLDDLLESCRDGEYGFRASAERADGPVQGYRATRSASATRTDTAIHETPQSISVVSSLRPRKS